MSSVNEVNAMVRERKRCRLVVETEIELVKSLPLQMEERYHRLDSLNRILNQIRM